MKSDANQQILLTMMASSSTSSRKRLSGSIMDPTRTYICIDPLYFLAFLKWG